MNIDYTIGDDIVAIKDHSQGLFKKGDTFPCKALKNGPCGCGAILVDIGKISSTNICRCNKCNLTYIDLYNYFVNALMFKKLEFDISELTEILEKENINTV